MINPIMSRCGDLKILSRKSSNTLPGWLATTGMISMGGAIDIPVYLRINHESTNNNSTPAIKLKILAIIINNVPLRISLKPSMNTSSDSSPGSRSTQYTSLYKLIYRE
jgi:hypothetical protein